MTPGKVGIWIVLAIVFGLIGTAIGKGKGRADAGWWLGFLLGIVGVIIIACLSPTEEHKVQQAQRQYEIQAEAARRVGYQYPPKPYAPYSPPGQDPEAPPQPYSPSQSYAPYPPPVRDHGSSPHLVSGRGRNRHRPPDRRERRATPMTRRPSSGSSTTACSRSPPDGVSAKAGHPLAGLPHFLAHCPVHDRANALYSAVADDTAAATAGARPETGRLAVSPD